MGTKYYNSYSEMVEDKPVAGTKGVVHPISLVMEFDGNKWGSAGGGSVLSESEWIKLGEYYTTVESSVTGIDNTYTVANAISALDAAVADIKTNATLNGVNLFHNGEWGQEIYAEYIWCLDDEDRDPNGDSVAAKLKQLRVDVDNISSISIASDGIIGPSEITINGETKNAICIFGENIKLINDGSTGWTIYDAIVQIETAVYGFGMGGEYNNNHSSLSSRMYDVENAIQGTGTYENSESLDQRVTSLEGDSDRITTLEQAVGPESGVHNPTSNIFPLSQAVDALIDRTKEYDQDFITIKANIEELQNNQGGSSGSVTVGSKTDNITITLGTGADNPGVGYRDENGYYRDGVTGEIMPTNWDPGWDNNTTLSQALSIISRFAAMTEQSHVDFRRFTVQSVNGVTPDTSTAEGSVRISGEDIYVSGSETTTIADKFNSLTSSTRITSINGISPDSYGSSDITITGQDITLSSDDSVMIADKISELDSKCFGIKMNGEELYPYQDENGYSWIDLNSPRVEEINIENLSLYSFGLHTSLADVIENLNISTDRQYGSSQLFLPTNNIEVQVTVDDIVSALESMGVYTSYDDNSGSYFPYSMHDVIYALIRKASSSLTIPDWSTLTEDAYGFVTDNTETGSGDGTSISGTLSAFRTYTAIVPCFLVVQTSQEHDGTFTVSVNDKDVFSSVKNCCIPIGAGDSFRIDTTSEYLTIGLAHLK